MRKTMLILVSVICVPWLGVLAEDYCAVGESAAFDLNLREVDSAWFNGATVHYGGAMENDETWTAGGVHVVYGTVVVATNVTLTIEPGAVVKFIGGGLYAAGTCVANGVTFTDIVDGMNGGHGETTLPMPSYVLKGNIETDNATRIRFAKNGDEFAAKGESGGFALNLRMDVAVPEGAVEHEGGTLASDETWAAGSIHVVYGTLIVPEGVTLTIEPGAVVKFLGGGLYAVGTCIANGVTFTDISDGVSGCLAIPSYVLQGNVETDGATKIRFAKTGDEFAANGGSGAFRLDITDDEFRLAHEEEQICFSSAWANGTGVKVSVTRADGGVETLVNEIGAAVGVVSWTKPDTFGVYEFRHESSGETLTARFAVLDGIVHDDVTGANEIWSKDKVHIISHDVSVKDGAMLTIEPGAVVKFLEGKMLTIEPGGVCMAEGVVFTSIHDDTVGGDSLNDGAATEPGANGYAIVGFVKDDLATEYRYGVQSYAGTLVGEVTWHKERTYVIDGTLTVASGASLTIPAGTVVKFTDGGTLKIADGGVCVAEGAIFTHIADDTVGGDTMGDGDATQPEYGKYIVDVAVLDDNATEYRYSAPIVTSGTLSGDNVWRARQVYHVTGNLTLTSGATLTIAPGSVIKFDPNVSLTVNSGATLNAQGTRSSPIIFTSIKDDDHGGDTNGDGDSTLPNPGDWVKICVNGGVANLNYAKILYSSKNATTGAINMTSSGGKVVFVNGEIAHAAYDAIGVESGNCYVTNSVIHDCLLAFRHWTKDPIVNCVIYDCGRLTQGGGQHFYNCIFSRITETWEAFGFPQNGTTYNNCCFWNDGGSVLTAEGTQDALTVCGKNGNIWADPKFVDPANGDFRIEVDSPCVDAGDATIAPAKDWYGQPRQGTAPDAGIYEALPRYVESDIDLSASGLYVSEVWRIGEEETVSWDEENIGTELAAGGWRDKIELVSLRDTSGKFDVSEFQTVLSLPAGAKSPCKKSICVPIVPEGEYLVMVTVNHARDVFEGTLTENNTTISGTVRIETATLNAADGGSGVLSAGGEGVLHFAIAPGSQNRLMAVRASGGVTALFGASRVPTLTANIGSVSAREGLLYFLVPEGVSDIYVRLGNDTSGSVSYTIDFSATTVAILGLSAATVPYDGQASILVDGAGFGRVSEVRLRAANGGDVRCGKWQAESDSVMSMTVDGTALAQGGTYAIVLRDSDGGETVSAYALTVTSEPAKAKAWARLVVPEEIREGRAYLCKIEYGNDGNADAVAPVFEVSRVGDGAFCLAGDEQQHEKLYFVGAGTSGNAGVLLPGEKGTIDFLYVAGVSQVETTHIRLHKAEDIGIADAAARLGRRGEDPTSYARAKELAQLVAAGATNGVYYGTVKDSNGEPVGDYLVSVTNGDAVVRALTDPKGRYVTEPCRVDDTRVDFTVSALPGLSYVEVEGATDNVAVFAINRETGETFAPEELGADRYTFRGLPDGVYAIKAMDGDLMAAGVLHVSDGEYGIVSLELNCGGNVSGTFTGDGTEVSPLILLASADAERIAEVGADGTFKFSNLPKGEYLIMYCGNEYLDYTMNDSLEVSAGGNARFDIVKTNNIVSSSTALKSMTRKKAVHLLKSSSDSYLSTIQYYLRLLDQNHPQPPPSDRNCEHNRKLYRKDKLAFLAMYNLLLSYSCKCDELEDVERLIAENQAEILKEGASQAISIAKNCKKLMALLPALAQMIRTYEITDKAQSLKPEPGKANEFCLQIMDALLNAKDYSVAMAHLANAFNGLKAFRTSLTKFTLTNEKQLIKTFGKWGLDLCRNTLAVANTLISLKHLHDSARVRYDLLQRESALKGELSGLMSFNFDDVLQNRSYPLCCNGDEDDFDDPPEDKKKVVKKKSRDPNEMAGPQGVGEQRFVKSGEWLTYTIYFENQTNATAAAQEVYVTNPLSEWLDWSTFEMGEVAFNNQIDIGLSGKNGGTCEATMKGTNFIVRTKLGGGGDGNDAVATSGVAHWYLRIVDPTTETGWPTDVTAGFLPPNDETLRGEGHLTYRIKVRDDAPANVKIVNSATIVFDYNDPIETEPNWTNTVAQVASVTIHDGEGNAVTNEVFVGVPYGDTLPEAPTNEVPGYSFAGWRTGPNGTGRLVTAESLVEAGDSGLYASWTANNYIIAYNANGGEGEMPPQTNTYDSVSNLASNAFTRTGYRYLGWATSETGAAIYGDGAAVSNLTTVAGGVVDLYAVWELITMEVSFDANDGSLGTSNPTMVVTNGVAYGVLPEVDRVGYAFDGWANGLAARSTRVAETTIVTNETDHTLYAQWTANTYEVAFHANGGEGEMPNQTNTYDLASRLASNVFTKIGHTFAGWATNEAGAVVYGDGAAVSNLTAVAGGTVDLFAAWSTVAGTAEVAVEIDGVTTNLTLTAGEPFGELPDPGTRDGFTFGGWFTGPGGTGIRVTPDTPVPEGLTGLYAYWVADEPEPILPVYALHDAPAYGGIGSSAYKGGTFNGYVLDGDGLISGTFTLAVKKPKKGASSAAATLTFTSLATGKKTKIVGTVDLATGAGGGGLAGLTLGADAVGGTVAKAGTLDGGADAAKAKNAAALSVLSKFSGKAYVLALAPENPDAYAQGGFSTLSIAMAAKGKAKVSGVLADGTKVTATAQMTVGDAYCCVPVIYSKKSKFGFVAWFDKDTRALAGVTALTPWRNTAKPAFTMDWAVAGSGAKGSLAAGTRTVALDGAKLSVLVPGAIAQTPFEILLTVKGAKWDAGKAAKVAYKGGALTVNGANVSGLKLTYTAKTGLFKGSFTVYAVKGGKLVKTKFTVNGAVTDGIGYGTAVLKGNGSVAVSVE